MKSTICIIASLIAISTPSTSAAETESNLRGSEILDEPSRKLGYATRKEGWLAAHNSRRETVHTELGGTYVPLEWSNALKRDAAKLAKSMAKTCTAAIPPNMKYGINLNARKGYPRVPTTEWVVKGWEADIDDEKKNGMIVQALWSGSEYVGCADSYNSDVDKKCSVSVCLYAKVSILSMYQHISHSNLIGTIHTCLRNIIILSFQYSSYHFHLQAGNCNMENYSSWQEAVMNGPGCGVCPPDFPDC